VRTLGLSVIVVLACCYFTTCTTFSDTNDAEAGSANVTWLKPDEILLQNSRAECARLCSGKTEDVVETNDYFSCTLAQSSAGIHKPVEIKATKCTGTLFNKFNLNFTAHDTCWWATAAECRALPVEKVEEIVVEHKSSCSTWCRGELVPTLPVCTYAREDVSKRDRVSADAFECVSDNQRVPFIRYDKGLQDTASSAQQRGFFGAADYCYAPYFDGQTYTTCNEAFSDDYGHRGLGCTYTNARVVTLSPQYDKLLAAEDYLLRIAPTEDSTVSGDTTPAPGEPNTGGAAYPPRWEDTFEGNVMAGVRLSPGTPVCLEGSSLKDAYGDEWSSVKVLLDPKEIPVFDDDLKLASPKVVQGYLRATMLVTLDVLQPETGKINLSPSK